MNIKEIINKIKIFLNEETITLKDVKTTDGIILSFEELAPGADIFIVDEEGRNPAQSGEYILEDGTKITVEEGKIMEIEAPEMVEAPVEEVPMPIEEKELETTNTDLATTTILPTTTDMSEKVSKLENDIIEIKSILSQLVESFSQQNFKEEVKMSIVKEPKKESKETFDMKPITNKSDLSSILKNMYK